MPCLDRQFDGLEYFEFIDQELQDEFVIRAKISRNSNESEADEQTAETVAVKLKEIAFAHTQSWILKKVRVKKKVYQDAKCLIEWDTLVLNGRVCLLFWLNVELNAEYMIFGLIVALFLGGAFLFQHFQYLAILHTPRHNLLPFLNQATDLLFLQRLGGSYRFIHRSVQEYFAARWGQEMIRNQAPELYKI